VSKMAIMSRKKQAIGRTWEAKNKEREQTAKSEHKEREISEEEHKEKLELLKGLGLIKENSEE
jgi:hypothetical protein